MKIKMSLLFSILMFIITLVIGIYACYIASGNFIVRTLQRIGGLLPAIAFAKIVHTMLKNKEHPFLYGRYRLASILLFLALPFYYFIFLFSASIAESIFFDTSVARYKIIDKEMEKAFPKKIPSYASNVKYANIPGPLQAKSSILLYYVDNDFSMEKYQEKFDKEVTSIGNATSFETVAFEYFEIPTDQIDDFVLYFVKKECDSEYCNHGETLYTAINEKTKEIIYEWSDW